MDWKQTLVVSGVVLMASGAVLGSAWLMHLDHTKEVREIHREFSAEMRGFQVSVAEFQATMARQDAEFKAHMIYYHSAE